MKFNFELVKYALLNVKKRKMRSSLTILSILIGVTAIYALVSFGVGLQNYVNVIGEQAGVDKLFLQSRGIGVPGTDANFFISKDDVDFVDKINGVQEITGLYVKTLEIKKDRQLKFVFGSGIDPKKWEFIEESFTVGVKSGRALKEGDLDKIVLGHNYEVADKIFKNPIVLGEKVEVNGKKFEVVGFFEEIGNPQDDTNIYLTYDTFEGMFPESRDRFGWAMIKASRGTEPSALADRINERLRKHKGQEKGKEDFFVQTFEDALQTFTNVITVLNAILALIALISVIVAGVNTTNTMYTAVLERTKEIGIMKAVGARNSSIMFIYVIESGFVGMIGGAAGVFLGFLISSAGGAIAAASGFSFLKPAFPIWLTLGCIMFAFCVGAASGTMPAIRASKLRPVDALRYE
ncbi:ABC transporter permease [Candidatus Woesearchaeota archaeon]|nr:ABC transporter permease [Candidatus Woesearchaeota archaeon]